MKSRIGLKIVFVRGFKIGMFEMIGSFVLIFLSCFIIIFFLYFVCFCCEFFLFNFKLCFNLEYG